MSSIIEGYSYDIFISYRQKDNKGDKWVSKFVEALKTELEATFKEDVSVYFDENPHDRLQETHNVDKSLEGKLKCLIFVPILSQTYCDPNSYAWQYEFLAFLRLAEQDRFGKDIKLRSGNVASRILPIRIHDLETEDVKLFEKETDCVLRAMDFVFKTASGVNRPLKANEDHPQDNLNKTFYSDQINKVAHAIKEIILGMKTEPVTVSKEKAQTKITFDETVKEEKKLELKKPIVLAKNKLLSTLVVAVILIIIGLFIYPKIFKRDTLENLRAKGKISVAVMPFKNMTNDITLNVYSDVIQTNLVNLFSNYSEELRVRQTESVNSLIQGKGLTNYASITPSMASNISQKLDADVFIFGDIQQAGTTLRVYAQLINSNTEEVYKSFQINIPSKEEINYHIIDSLSLQVKDFLILSHLKQDYSPEFRKFESTKSPEAYMNYISGQDAFEKSDFIAARDNFLEAIKLDSNYTLARIWLSVADLNLSLFEEGKKCILNAYEKRDQMSAYMKNKVEDIHSWYTIGPQGRIKYLKQLIDLDDQDPTNYLSLGNSYKLLNQFNYAITVFEQTLEIYKKWRLKPYRSLYSDYLGLAYHKTGQYKKEKKLYKKAEQDFPDDPAIIYRQAVLALSEGKTKDANDYIEKYESIIKENSASEAAIATNLGAIYSEAQILDKAEEYYRKALSLKPENLNLLNALAYFLINKDRNINEGLELISKALESSPENYNYLHTKGWGLYKQGKYKEALEILQNRWDLRMKNAIYDHEAYLHFEADKKAVADQKNN
jgi:tetratricopeptide (TPR) repeat protein